MIFLKEPTIQISALSLQSEISASFRLGIFLAGLHSLQFSKRYRLHVIIHILRATYPKSLDSISQKFQKIVWYWQLPKKFPYI